MYWVKKRTFLCMWFCLFWILQNELYTHASLSCYSYAWNDDLLSNMLLIEPSHSSVITFRHMTSLKIAWWRQFSLSLSSVFCMEIIVFKTRTTTTKIEWDGCFKIRMLSSVSWNYITLVRVRSVYNFAHLLFFVLYVLHPTLVNIELSSKILVNSAL